jgi:uncharacterized protein with LGFP repeats
MFWLPAQGVELWESTGGRSGRLGFPAANLRVVGDGAVVEFAHGSMSVPAADVAAALAGEPISITIDYVEDPADPLPSPMPTGAIIRQWNGTSWWIDADNLRHWIADGGTWRCLGGEDVVVADELPGWAVWTFPLAEPARC